MLLASIPSPTDPFIFHLGPLAPRWYGVLLAVGILIAILVTRRQLVLRGRDPGIAGEVAVWAVPCGVIGARLYHVVTDWSAFSGISGRSRSSRRAASASTAPCSAVRSAPS